jgi:D-alanyl-lipoteichoic acid acyltransferase DltB (MBOAT superfamily)
LQENYCQKYLLYVDVAASDFTFVNYIIYIFYPPFYFSGPTITFNSFIFQFNTQTKARFSREKFSYLIRLVIILITLEVYNHLIYPHAFLTNSRNEWMFHDFENHVLTMMLYQNLVFIWLKFIFIWRSARFFALLDNIESEENMNRCVYNNYNFEGFWRAWHRSFNQWLIKYIFIPLGGNKYKFLNIWVIFTFVALWHDLEIKLLVWAWFICIFLIPEIIGKIFVSKVL